MTRQSRQSKGAILVSFAAFWACTGVALRPGVAWAATDSPGPERVLVVYNATWTGDEDGDGIQDSLQVARYYMDKRGVPKDNLLGLAIAGTNWSGDYASGTAAYAQLQTQMIQPIKARLAELGPTNIDIILMSYHLPVEFIETAGSEGLSIDNMLMGMNYWTASMNNFNVLYLYENPYLEPNPTFGPNPDHGHFDHAYKFRGGDMYLVTRLDGPLGVNGCLDMIDQALYADRFLASGTGNFNGTVYIDSRGDKGAALYTDAALTADPDVMNGNFYSYAAADVNVAYGEHYVLSSGFPLKWQAAGGIIGSPGLTYTDGTSAETAPRVFLYGGWYAYQNYQDVFEWLPGSVACDLNSTSLCYYWFRGPSLAWAGNALYHGATCVQGATTEPQAYGHPRPNVMIWAMLNGFNFAEAAGLSTPYLGWRALNLGDPLYRPLKPGKTVIRDTRAPTLASGYPKIIRSESRGVEVNILIDDSVEPETSRVRLEYGRTTAYGSTVIDPRYFRRHVMRFMDLVPGTTYHYRLVLTDPVCNTTTTGDYTFESPAEAPWGGTAAQIPGMIQAEYFDTGGEGVAYHCGGGTPIGGAVRGETGVNTWGTGEPQGAPGFVSCMSAGQWLNYTVVVAQSGQYTLDACVGGSTYPGGYFNPGGTFHLEFDGVNKTGPLVVPTSGTQDWDNWVMLTKTGINLTAGTHIMRLSMDINGVGGGWGNTGAYNWLKFTQESGVQIYGDLNGDGEGTMADLNVMVDWFLLRSAAPTIGTNTFTVADVDGSGVLDMSDLNLIIDKLLMRIAKFPVEP